MDERRTALVPIPARGSLNGQSGMVHVESFLRAADHGGTLGK